MFLAAPIVWAIDNKAAYYATRNGQSHSNALSVEIPFIVDNIAFVAHVPTADNPGDEPSRGRPVDLTRGTCKDAWRPSLAIEWKWDSR